jgi:hypothetical protein
MGVGPISLLSGAVLLKAPAGSARHPVGRHASLRLPGVSYELLQFVLNAAVGRKD